MEVQAEEKEVTRDSVRAESDSVIDKAMATLDNPSEKVTTEEDTSSSETTSEEKAEDTKSAEDTTSKKSETDKEKEAEVPKEFHKHPAWQRIIKERDTMKAQLAETQKTVIPKEEIEKFNKTISSPEYIRQSMKAQGYTDEAINSALVEKGFKVEPKPQDDLQLVLSKLNVNVEGLTQEQKDYVNTQVQDMINIANILIEDKLGKKLPEVMKPLQDNTQAILQKSEAEKLVGKISNIIKEEGILDMEKDVEPLLDEYIEKNPKATQQDIFAYFKDLNHKLTIERLKLGKKKEARDEEKGGLKGHKPGVPSTGRINLPKLKPGESFDKHLDSILDASGIA